MARAVPRRADDGPPRGREFWRYPPIDTDDPESVHRSGIGAATRRDGNAMIAAGWTMAVINGGGDGRWFEHVHSGFGVWRSISGYDSALGRRYLEQLVAPLADDLSPPVAPRALVGDRHEPAAPVPDLDAHAAEAGAAIRIVVGN